MEENYSFGYWIRRRRKALDLTQEQLAHNVACTLSTIKKIELDQRRPSRLMAERLADCLRIPAAEKSAFLSVALSVRSPVILVLEREPISKEPTHHHRTNLTIPATRMIGRVEQIAEIIQLLQNPDVRMLTFTGPGGVGKTRLANHIATYLTPEFNAGTWLVELAPLSIPSQVLQVVASTLGIQLSVSKTPLESVISYLLNKHLLLLLDNCEHLVDECAHVAHALLSSCKGLVIICTSREPINIPEEYTWSIPPLALPGLETSLPVDQIVQNESISLFMDRAIHVMPSFVLTPLNSTSIINICHRLDGIPLAIELAAAHIRLLSPVQIEAKLDDAMLLLELGYRTADIRQQTMSAAIEWSFTTLTRPEQVLLRRLSTFSGTWTLEAAEEICSTEENLPDEQPAPCVTNLHHDEILSHLTTLVNKSLVNISQKQDGEKRFYLLEIIRQYSQIKLTEAGEQELLQLRHLEYYMHWAEFITPELFGPDQMVWLKTLDLELENLRSALTWGQKLAPAYGLRLAASLYRYWRFRNLYLEGVDWLNKYLDFPENQAPTRHRAFALGVLCSLAFSTAPAPEVWANESISICETLHDEATLAFAHWMLGAIYYLRYENFDQGHYYLQLSYEGYRKAGNRWGMAQVLFHLANLASYAGDSLLQRDYLTQSLDLYRQIGDLHGIANALDNLANANLDIDGDLGAAQLMVEEAIAIFQKIELPEAMYNALFVYGYILAWKGDYPHARQALQDRLEPIRRSGALMNVVLAEVLIAGVDRLAGLEDQALTVLENSLATMDASDPQLVQNWHYSRTLHELAYIFTRRGDTGRARSLLQKALDMSDMPEERALLFHCRGTVALVENKGNEALDDFLQSLKLCNHCLRIISILALEGFAHALYFLSYPHQATHFLASAAEFRHQIGAPVSVWDMPVYNHLIKSLQDQLVEPAYTAAWEEGQSISFDQAIDNALAFTWKSASLQ